MLEPQNSIHTYSSDWAELGSRPDFAQSLSFALDASFDWINDAMSGRYSSIESQRAKMLEESPRLNIKNRNDGFDLEAERLLAIQQKNSRGFNIVDINPGLLDPIEFSMSLPYEFIFDGTNFMPDINGSLSTQFRTVTVPIAGNFLKVEFINEINSQSNFSTNISRPYAKRKYTGIVTNEQDLVTGQTNYSFDNFARTKVFVNFNTVSEKPHLVMRSGDSFNTYFNEVSITLSVGAPKIRLTIGYNSEKQDGPSYAEFNSKLSMSGVGRLLRDSDTTLSPFCITEIDNFVSSYTPEGESLSITIPVSTYSKNLVQNLNASLTGNNEFYGYSILWITRIRFKISRFLGSAMSANCRVSLVVSNVGATQVQRIHSFVLDMVTSPSSQEYVYEPAEPLCVVIPSYCAMTLIITSWGSLNGTVFYSHSIDGYSLGEILSFPYAGPPASSYLVTSKYITDATMLSYYNRINQISRY